MASLEMTENWRLLEGDVLEQLATLGPESVQCVVTSPPYWGLRDYKVAGQMGLEETIGEWVENMVIVFREVRRVLQSDGTVWLNLGDCYWTGAEKRDGGHDFVDGGKRKLQQHKGELLGRKPAPQQGLKPKDLVGTPWLVAFALRADGWWLRQEIIWSKPNPMPESVADRPTRAHEQVFLLTKAERYYYDAAAIREPVKDSSIRRLTQPTFDRQEGGPKDMGTGNRSCRRALTNMHAKMYARVPAGWDQSKGDHEDKEGRYPDDKQRGHGRRHAGFNDRWDAMEKAEQQLGGANKRTVWEIATQPYLDAHFATFPEALVKPCVLAGSRAEDIILDPFSGSGTTGVVALGLGRRYVGIELNPEYNELARKRLRATPCQTMMPI